VRDIFEEVNVLETDEIFAGFEKNKTVLLAESHWDYVTKASLDRADLVLFADSHSCEVEVVKQKKKPFYCFQFHPERIRH
jgi:GMP synthase-like glutamine amidotransferase